MKSKQLPWIPPMSITIRRMLFLLGPQISIYINNVRKQSNKPVAVIDSKSYGRYRGDEVLLAAEKLFEESRK